jgi:DNA-directed RNA polymerase specialized sigma24 family protein
MMRDDDAGEDETGPLGGSVTRWVHDLKEGDELAAYELWKRYFHRLVGLANQKLRKLDHHAIFVDGEDLAQSAFQSLCDGASHGRFDQLGDRDDLWRLLVVITSRKASDQKLRDLRQKRGGGRVRTETEVVKDLDGPGRWASLWDQIPSDEPTPEFAAMIAEEYQRRLASLGKDELRRIAVLRMEGYSNEEIAAQLNCALRTVARRLDMIRATWGAGEPAGQP